MYDAIICNRAQHTLDSRPFDYVMSECAFCKTSIWTPQEKGIYCCPKCGFDLLGLSEPLDLNSLLSYLGSVKDSNPS